MNNSQIYQIALEVRRIAPLTIRQLRFILNWYDLMGTAGKEFGFRGVDGLNEQIKLAVNFYLETEREWQSRVLNGEKMPVFLLYFINRPRKTNIL